jgi:hypothetical protein
MSSWERSRFIPWTRIPLPDTRPRGPGEIPPVDLDTARERIFRDLQREIVEDELRTQDRDLPGAATTDGSGAASASTKVPYSHMELLRQAAFGGCIGTITGGVFGFMDGMRSAGESSVLQKASNMAKGRFLMQGTTRSATMFGVFFSGFHILKYGLRCTVDPGEYAEIALAAPVALGVLAWKPTTRQAMPYASMLVLMDGVNIYMRSTD